MCWSYTNIWFRLGQNSSVLLVIKTSFWHFHKQYFPLFPLKIHPKSMLFHQNCIHQFIFLLFSVQSCHFWCWRPGQRWVLSFGKLLDGPNLIHQDKFISVDARARGSLVGWVMSSWGTTGPLLGLLLPPGGATPLPGPPNNHKPTLRKIIPPPS